MTSRLTRAHRREIEKKTHQRIDLDDLSKFETDQLASDKNDVPTIEEIKKSQKEEKKDKEEKVLNKKEEEEEEEENNPSEEEDDDSSEEDSSDSSDNDDEDLDALLSKAQEALTSQTASIQLGNDSTNKINTKLSKMNSGISVEKELYFKHVAGRAKLIPDAVALVDDGEKASSKATVVLKPNKDEKQLNKKERQAVSLFKS
jgi:hypothetical protein